MSWLDRRRARNQAAVAALLRGAATDVEAGMPVTTAILNAHVPRAVKVHASGLLEKAANEWVGVGVPQLERDASPVAIAEIMRRLASALEGLRHDSDGERAE